MFNKARRAFTLVEIMIVVLIIGILLAIAVPNFVKARESSRTKACIANLKQIEAAKQQWAMDFKQNSTDSPGFTDLVGSGKYISGTAAPTCPSGGTYDPQNVDTLATCSTGGTHTL
jgi:prepilin-type N-terminal cleavage/methylation domain-containing protein